MAAPKKWGYTRAQPIPDELLVAWADGDLIQILDKEIVERLLTHPDERQHLAAFARAAQDTVEPADGGPDRIARPRAGVVERCQGLGHGEDLDPAPAPPGPQMRLGGRSLALPLPPGQMVGLGFVLVLTAALVLWMLRNL